MGLIENIAKRNHVDWCRKCKREMQRGRKRLFAIPRLNVGHYVEHMDPEFYWENLFVVDSRLDIPAGMYACWAVEYRCPACGGINTEIKPFLPVRDLDKREKSVVFRSGELDDFLWL